jgi:hypothetical protein
MNTSGARWTDPLVNLWYRFTYCRRHGHRYSAFGSPPGGVDDYCMNCGKNR